jgi:hypothetical protein
MDVMMTFFSRLGVLPSVLLRKDTAAVMAGSQRLAKSIEQLRGPGGISGFLFRNANYFLSRLKIFPR